MREKLKKKQPVSADILNNKDHDANPDTIMILRMTCIIEKNKDKCFSWKNTELNSLKHKKRIWISYSILEIDSSHASINN